MPTYPNQQRAMPDQVAQQLSSYAPFGQVQTPDPYSPTYSIQRGTQYQQTAPTIPGRFIESPDQITPREVPMDGSIAYFPTKDLQTIFAKMWNQNGTIDTAVYVLQQQAKPAQDLDIPAFLQALDQRLGSIESKLKKLQYPRNNKSKKVNSDVQ